MPATELPSGAARDDEIIETSSPLGGGSQPIHGGSPGHGGCAGCTDCCHLPEISITDEEAVRLRELYHTVPALEGPLQIEPDSKFAGWQIMRGPCVFRQLESPLAAGGCRIYADRPAGCGIFTCPFLLHIRRSEQHV